MRKLAYGVLSGFIILTTTIPVIAGTPTVTVAQSNSNLERMYREQRVFADEMKTMMAQMKRMMAEMKVLTSAPDGQTPTIADLYKQQQVLIARMETLTNPTKLETLLPRKNAATTQEVYQQQVAMMAEMKTMMAEMKTMMELYRGRGGRS
ncbi:MAG: hypothetical protein KME42_04370 [Tildeniella nuda ZEHNDER 1965/U140]|jgi:hypothetical protein|nr:hypothetical protein [Tildeniella nuda ZEHNDER 1965/U140]